MSEGQLMEILIAAGSVVLVVGAVSAIVYKVTVGDGQARRLDKLKDELTKQKKG